MMSETRQGAWLQTWCGVQFWPMDPRPEEILIDDIAHALANLSRFGGHCRIPYSVAQHSVLVAQNVPEEDRLWGLLHDASEAYIGDVITPVKSMLPGYKEMEAKVMAAVCKRFDLPEKMPESVKIADARILKTEAESLLAARTKMLWNVTAERYDFHIEPWKYDFAEHKFRTLATKLMVKQRYKKKATAVIEEVPF